MPASSILRRVSAVSALASVIACGGTTAPSERACPRPLGEFPDNACSILTGTATDSAGVPLVSAGLLEPVTIDLDRHLATLVIDDATIESALPADLKEVRYIGYYTKGTRSLFGPMAVETH